jgi:hypothetical protein
MLRQSQSRPMRDKAELALLGGALKRDMPVLGICRGSQILNVALGGDLYQHLPDFLVHERHKHDPPGVFLVHEVAIESGLGIVCSPLRGDVSMLEQGESQARAGAETARPRRCLGVRRPATARPTLVRIARARRRSRRGGAVSRACRSMAMTSSASSR